MVSFEVSLVVRTLMRLENFGVFVVNDERWYLAQGREKEW